MRKKNRKLGDRVVNYFLITNMELDCVMLYLMVSLDDHQGHEHVTLARQLLTRPRNFAPVDSFVIAQLSPKLKIQRLQRNGWILCSSNNRPMYHYVLQ